MMALLAVLLLLVAVDEATGFRNGFARSHRRVQQRQNSDHLRTKDVVVEWQPREKSTTLYSLGDPDTNGESNFYRW